MGYAVNTDFHHPLKRVNIFSVYTLFSCSPSYPNEGERGNQKIEKGRIQYAPTGNGCFDKLNNRQGKRIKNDRNRSCRQVCIPFVDAYLRNLIY